MIYTIIGVMTGCALYDIAKHYVLKWTNQANEPGWYEQRAAQIQRRLDAMRWRKAQVQPTDSVKREFE